MLQVDDLAVGWRIEAQDVEGRVHRRVRSRAKGQDLKGYVPGGARRDRAGSLLIGTASSIPRLGYTIPPGDWGIQATLTLGPHPRDSPRRRTPILPLTITA